MLKKIIKVGLVILVLILAYKLRIKNYDQVPIPGQSMDEYSYTWVGMSLIQLGRPVGISGINGYPENDWHNINVDRVYQNTGNADPLAVNKPWFDHPPMLGLITGSYTYLRGGRVFEDANIFLIRRPMVYLGVFTVLLIFLLGYVNFNYLTGLVSALIYGTIPFIVVGSRMAQGENGMLPLFLLALFFFSIYKKTKSLKWLLFSAISAGIATLFKLSGVVAILSILILLFIDNDFKEHRFKQMLLFASVSFSLTFLFFVYGFVYDANTFKNILFSNSNRFYGIGPAAIYNLITQTKITNTKYFTEPWVIPFWISFFVLSIKNKKNFGDILLIISTLAYLLTYLIFGSQPFGWYAIPFWPILSLILGRILILAFNNCEYLNISTILLIIPFGFNLTRFINIENFQKYSSLWRLTMALILFLLMLSFSSKPLKIPRLLSRLFLLIIFSISIYLNIKYVNSINIDLWYHIN